MAYPNFDFIKMGRRIEARGLVRRGKVGQADAMLVRAGELVQAALEILEAEPETVVPDPDFAYWLKHVKDHSLTLPEEWPPRITIFPAGPPQDTAPRSKRAYCM